jgi:hypothetical protein
MEFRSKTEIIQDIERFRKQRRQESHRGRASETMNTLTLGLQATRRLAATGYSLGREQLRHFEHQLQAHTYGAISIAVSAGAIAGLAAGHKLKAKPSPDSDGEE